MLFRGSGAILYQILPIKRPTTVKQYFSILITCSITMLSGCVTQNTSITSGDETTAHHWIVNQQHDYTVSAVGTAVRDNGTEMIAQIKNYLDGHHSVKLVENIGSCNANEQVPHTVESIILVGHKYMRVVSNNYCMDGELSAEYVFSSGCSKIEDQKLNSITYTLFNGLEVAGVTFESTGVKKVIDALVESDAILRSVNKT